MEILKAWDEKPYIRASVEQPLRPHRIDFSPERILCSRLAIIFPMMFPERDDLKVLEAGATCAELLDYLNSGREDGWVRHDQEEFNRRMKRSEIRKDEKHPKLVFGREYADSTNSIRFCIVRPSVVVVYTNEYVKSLLPVTEQSRMGGILVYRDGGYVEDGNYTLRWVDELRTRYRLPISAG